MDSWKELEFIVNQKTDGKTVGIRTTRQLAAVKASIAPRRFLRIADVRASVSLSAGCIYKLVQRGDFPAPVKLTPRTSAWLISEVDLWIERRAHDRQQKAS